MIDPLKVLAGGGHFYFGLFGASGSAGPEFAQALAGQVDAVRGVHDSVKDGVCGARVSDGVIPVCHGKLRCDDDGFSFVPVFHDLDEQRAFLGVERHQEQVVEDEQLGIFYSLERRGWPYFFSKLSIPRQARKASTG